jgi:peptidoglycan/LPS O-acetylase OafA/YrhL
MTRIISQKFRFLTFVSIALLSYVHGYNLHEKYLTPYSSVSEPLTFTTFFEYFFANGLLRFRIPILFLISGYLYAMYDVLPYGVRTRRRFMTLIVPFFLWSALSLLFTFLLQQHPYTALVVKTAGIDQLGDNRHYTEIGWSGILFRWVLNPPAFQLWFIFVLFVCNLLYPAIRWLLQRVPGIWLGITGVLWFTLFNAGFIDGQSLFFFSVGAWLKISNISLEKTPRWFSLGIAWILFIGIHLVRTFMAFELPPLTTSTVILLTTLYQIATLCGVLAVWFSVDELAKRAMSLGWFRRLTSYSFFLYGMHLPLLSYAMAFMAMNFGHLRYFRLPSYLLLPAIVMLICIATGWALKLTLPKFYSIVTGGRGI